MDTTDAPQMIEHIHKSLTFTPYDTRWIPCSARFVVMGMYPRAKGDTEAVLRGKMLRQYAHGGSCAKCEDHSCVFAMLWCVR